MRSRPPLPRIETEYLINEYVINCQNIFHRKIDYFSEQENDCCLTPSEKLFCYVLSYISMKLWSCLHMNSTPSWMSIVLAYWERKNRTTRTHYHESESASLCSYTLMLHKNSKYQFHSLWFYPPWGFSSWSTTLNIGMTTNKRMMGLIFYKLPFGVSEWLLIAIFQLYHGINKLYFNEMMMRSALF